MYVKRLVRHETCKLPESAFERVEFPIKDLVFFGRELTDPKFVIAMDDPDSLFYQEYLHLHPDACSSPTPHVPIAKNIDPTLLTTETKDDLYSMLPPTISFGPMKLGENLKQGVSVASVKPRKSARLQ